MPRVSRGPQLGILLLLYQLAGQIGLGNIPPATLVAIVSSIYLHNLQNYFVKTICIKYQSKKSTNQSTWVFDDA